VTSPELEIYRYTLQSDTKNLMELSEYQRWVIQPALRQVPGVAEVDNFGGFTRQFSLDLDPIELMRYGVGINDVINAINNNTAKAGGGRVARGDQSFIVRGVGLVHTLEDLGNVVVTQRNSMPILIRDLGSLSYAHQEPEGILGFNENPATLLRDVARIASDRLPGAMKSAYSHCTTGFSSEPADDPIQSLSLSHIATCQGGNPCNACFLLL
jgi:cobalt-zinc-cadmium resistance protein CzcA